MTLTLLSALFCACQGPETVERENAYEDPTDDEYELDLYFLSELAGRIIPSSEELSFDIEINTEGGDCKTYGKFKNENKICLDDVLINKNNEYTFNPYPGIKGLDLSYPCTYKNESPNIECNVWHSGAEAINNAWTNILKSNKNTVTARIGSGDNFGVSLPLSSYYDDLPTVLMLNKLDLDIETFGNHNFDNGLDYLQNAINNSEFSYVISNLYNIPNNLESVGSYSVIEIPSKKDSKNILPVAVISALDPESVDTISRGTFGTLGITDYCSIINELENAYNKNIRSFILISHFTEDNNIQAFAKYIYGLNDDSFQETNRCSSRLFISKQSIDDYISKNKVNTSDESAVSDAIKAIRTQMRKEIFNGILLIYGSAYTPSVLAEISKEMLDGYEEYKSNKEKENKKPTFQQYLADMSVKDDTGINKDIQNLNIFNSMENNSNTNANYFSYIANTQSIEPKDSFWFIQLPSQGNATAKASFTIKKAEKDSLPGITNRFFAQLTSADFVPVFAKEFDVGNEKCPTDNSDDCIKYDDYCQSVMDASPDDCKEYYNGYKDYHTKSQSEESRPLFENCENALFKDNYYKKQSFSYLERFWSCTYNITSWKWVKDEQYFTHNICQLFEDSVQDDRIIESEEKDIIRAFSTFISNLFTYAILDYVTTVAECKEKENDELCPIFKSAGGIPDAVLLNAGTFRGSEDFKLVSTNVLLTVMPVDYNNKPIITKMSRNKLVQVLEFQINNETTGAFPAIAGFHFSYKSGSTKTVTEILKVNKEQKYTGIYYLSKTVLDDIKAGKEVCVMGLKDVKNKCRVGTYHKNGDEIQATLYGDTLYSDSETVLTYNENVSNEKSMLKVLISDYMSTGGDKFDFDRNEKKQFPYKNYTYPDGSPMNLRNMVTEFFKGSSNTYCPLSYSPNTKSENPQQLVKLNLIKRIYSDSDVRYKETSIVDSSNASCIITQKVLARTLDMLDDCFYPDTTN